MSAVFPSLEFFRALQQRVAENRATFEKLGTCDTTFGVSILRDGKSELYSVEFEVCDCIEVARLDGPGERQLDFILEADYEVWREMLESVRAHQGAGAEYTLNTLSHLGDRMKVLYQDPEGHDTFYRFMSTVQAFFDEAAQVDFHF
jgi:pyrroloquinoline quinone (PQQ) biosynthesis protein C